MAECLQMPQVDSKLEASAAGVQALMEDIAAAAAAKSAELAASASGKVTSALEAPQVRMDAGQQPRNEACFAEQFTTDDCRNGEADC